MDSADSRTSKLGLGAMAVGLALVTLANPSVARGETSAVVIEWNRIAQGTVVGPLRPFVMTHIAMFDAVNSVADAYTPFHVHVPGSRGASQQAAAAQAAHDVLTAFFPEQQGRFDAALTSSLAGIPPGLAEQGKEVGRRVAQAVLEWRQNDGWPATITPDPEYVLPTFPGMYQPTPPANSAPTFTFYRNAAPFALVSSTHFLPPSPPVLTSERYARDFNQTKELGAVNSTVRTAEQTLLAQVVHGLNATPSFAVWNNVASDLVRRRGLSLIDAARLFALLNASLADGLQTSFTSKFVYNLWRPVTAIRQADSDMNDATTADPNWLPLLPTPPYPSYAGNMACLTSAAARALALGFGQDDIPFSVTWTRTMGLESVTREFAGFSQLAQRMALSRIHGGIHFQFDTDASLAVCPKVADYIHDNYMLPR